MRARFRSATGALRRAAWAAGVPYRPPAARAPRLVPIATVLGMHRSGTSAAVGVLEEHGFSVPAMAPEGIADNKRGTRESGWLVALSNDVLWLNGATWAHPPDRPLRYLNRHLARRNRIVDHCAGRQIVLKDPRMLLMLDLWAGVSLRPMGVVRNPIDVAESLMRRGDDLDQRQCIALWKTYNRALLSIAEEGNCPIAVFDRPLFSEQVTQCMRVHGYDLPIDSDPRTTERFFDDSVVRSRNADWRELVRDDDAAALYDKLAAFSPALSCTER